MEISVRDEMVPVPEGRTFLAAVRELHVAAIEVMVRHDFVCPAIGLDSDSAAFQIGDAAGARKLRQALEAGGVRAAALLLATDFSSEQADAHVDWAVRCIEAARELGAPAVRIDTYTRNAALDAGAIAANFIQRVSDVLERTADTGVSLGIENHGHISNDPGFLDDIFDVVEDERLGMTLDIGNFYWYGAPLDELYGLIERYAPRTVHTHIKSINYPPELARQRRAIGYEYGKYACPLDEGNIDIPRVVALLERGGYAGDLCIENEALGKYPVDGRADILRRDVASLRTALGQLRR